MMRVNVGKKLVFYSKQTLMQNETQINKPINQNLVINVLNSFGVSLLSKNRLFHSNFVNQMMQGLAQ